MAAFASRGLLDAYLPGSSSSTRCRSGLPPRSFFGEEADDPSAIGWMPAAAVYLQDPGGHSLEYLSRAPGGRFGGRAAG